MSGKKEARLKPAEAKTTPFRIQNPLVKTFSLIQKVPPLRGFDAVGVPLAKSEVI